MPPCGRIKEAFMKTLRRRNREKGQAFVEYVILVAVIALAALFVLANFSDRIKDMITGITVTLGGEADSKADEKSIDIIKDLEKDGLK
jgi:Flp pilus assembly pilin Flp